MKAEVIKIKASSLQDNALLLDLGLFALSFRKDAGKSQKSNF